MSMFKLFVTGCLTIVAACPLYAQTGYGLGSTVKSADLLPFFAIAPSGANLPPGKGDAQRGAVVYAEQCAACHGDHLQGNKEAGGDPLIGGQGSLTTAAPLRTVESYWPYATTLFDYIKRAMPFTGPGILSDNDVYSVVAFILSKAHIIRPSLVMDARTLPKVVMPNRNGFVPDPRPEPNDQPPSHQSIDSGKTISAPF